MYARISSDRDGDHLGVRRQVEDCERLIARKGWEVAERYVDDDVSAYKGRVRPAYRRMLDDVRGGFLDAVVVWTPIACIANPRSWRSSSRCARRPG